MNNSPVNLTERSFFNIACSRAVVVRACKVAMLVGTMLALINHSEKIINLSFSTQDWFKILLTYLVPYGVSTWSAVGAIKSNAANNAQESIK